jgi:amino-acid N-acetyltransferase
MHVTIGRAAPDELPGIVDLLTRSQLPPDGIEAHLATTLVAREGARLVGCSALELYDGAALLRSVAVEPDRRGAGLGRRLTEAALALARERAVRTVYLLTTTAAEFFPRFGFRPLAREAVAPAVRRSIEFTTACPDTALAMHLTLS